MTKYSSYLSENPKVYLRKNNLQPKKLILKMTHRDCPLPFIRMNLEILEPGQIVYADKSPCVVEMVNQSRAIVRKFGTNVKFDIAPGSEVAILKESFTPIEEVAAEWAHAERKGKVVENGEDIHAVVVSEQTKSAKIKALLKLNCGVKEIAQLLDCHENYVYNYKSKK